jgi:transcriptional regulator with XRE-family HTH domain
MGIGNRIKEARENLHLTQRDLGQLVGVTASAITNYEKEVSHPKEQILYKLMEALKCDANYLFQDSFKGLSYEFQCSLYEQNMIKKYRNIDDHGKELVDMVLCKEYYRCYSGTNADSTESTMEAEIASYRKELEAEASGSGKLSASQKEKDA